MKIITIETLKAFLDELNKKYGTEFYSKTEIDEKLKSSGGSVDLKELADRIPNFQYWLRIKQSPKQTITATCDGKEYTADVLIEKGKTVTVTVKADDGYIAGTLSKTELVMGKDTEITATGATKSEKLEAGSLEIKNGITTFQIPPKVQVLQFSFGNARKYMKVIPETTVNFNFKCDFVSRNTVELWLFDISSSDTYAGRKIYTRDDGLKSNKDTGTISWSKEINEHAWDIEL